MNITIVTPSLNQSGFIAKTFESILNQKGNFKTQYILVDGLSIDNTYNIIKNYQSKFRKEKIEFLVIKEKDEGQSDALNKGFKLAKGDILAFLNADDYYQPNILGKVNDFFEKNPEVEWAFGGWNIVNKSAKKYKTFQPKKFSETAFKTYGYNIGQPSCFFRKSLYKKAGPLDKKLHLALDYDLWLRFLQSSKPRIINLVISNMRYHQNAKSAQNTTRHNYEAFLVAKKYLPDNLFLLVLLYLNFVIGWIMIKLGRNISQVVK